MPESDPGPGLRDRVGGHGLQRWPRHFDMPRRVNRLKRPVGVAVNKLHTSVCAPQESTWGPRGRHEGQALDETYLAGCGGMLEIGSKEEKMQHESSRASELELTNREAGTYRARHRKGTGRCESELKMGVGERLARAEIRYREHGRNERAWSGRDYGKWKEQRPGGDESDSARREREVRDKQATHRHERTPKSDISPEDM
ncbi:hypothetical protein BV25DRAFT_1842982 [Artomyces pyxidatus]|uniref:Uncharacterized protein n=1 Tax=Artomyces pyxidatus TaxID=48021 RepID=A0ACB8SHJ5_9AGAM|nr:hypothetical protein BV25DRAFT_1842982 [Artomyces pyxidatus]